MKRILSALFLLLSSTTFSQIQGVAFPTVGKGVATPFVTDYHCLGINVSGLGWGTGFEGKRFTTGATEFGFGVFSDSLNSKKLRNFTSTFYNGIRNKDPQAIDFEKQKESAANYAEAGLAINVDFNYMGFAFQGEKFGGIAFNVRENYQWYSKLNKTTTDILFRGKLSTYFDSLTVVFGTDTSRVANNENMSEDSMAAVISGTISVPLRLSEVTNGSQIKMIWNRSYNLGYGRKVFEIDSVIAVFAGVGGRIIQSMAFMDLHSDGNTLVMTSALTPAIKIDYGSIAGANPLSYSGGIPPAVGNGYGVDLATSVRLFNKLTFAAAVNNVGSVTYTRNVYTVKDTLFGDFKLDGLQDADITQSINQLLREGGILHLEGKEKFKQANAADFRLGGAWEVTKFFRFGFDLVAPFNRENPGSIQNAVFSFGGDIRPFKWLQLSAGYFGGGVYQNNIPLGITFMLRGGATEMGIASRDALTFFTTNSNSVSTAFGFARFRF